jgi:membrane-associated phospholipid phosphatase
MKIIEYLRQHRISFLLAVLVIFWTPVVILAKIAGEIIEKEPIGFDIAILNWLHVHSNTFFDQFFLIITELGGIIAVVLVTLFLTIYLWVYKKRRRSALTLAFGVGGAAAANIVLKALFQRERPSLWHPSVIEISFSFPSGHAMASAALIACLVVILWKTKYRWLAVVAGTIIVALVGLSRMYLGVHYPSDVLAGWCASIAWVTIVVVILRLISRKLKRSTPDTAA